MQRARMLAVFAIAVGILFMAGTTVFASKSDNSTTPASALESASSLPSVAQMEEVVVALEANSREIENSDKPKVSKLAQVGNVIKRASSKVKDFAMRFLGTPYRWGGTTPKAFDCSGFTCYVYKNMGVKLPRTARAQYKSGKVVNTNSLSTGDLVFFDMRKGYVSHVGIYLGEGKFIHASTPKTGVRIDKMSSYRKHFVGARRFQSA